jgi:hypothetical protein
MADVSHRSFCNNRSLNTDPVNTTVLMGIKFNIFIKTVDKKDGNNTGVKSICSVFCGDHIIV